MYIYSTRLYYDAQTVNKIKLPNVCQKFQDTLTTFGEYPENTNLETIILRDLKIAYGMALDMEFISKFRNLKVFVVEMNDLRGSDRISFPKLICDMTKALSSLRHLECVELT